MIKTNLYPIILSFFLFSIVANLSAMSMVLPSDSLVASEGEDERKELGLLLLLNSSDSSSSIDTLSNDQAHSFSLTVLDSLRLASSVLTTDTVLVNREDSCVLQLLMLQGDSIYVDSLVYASSPHLQRVVEIVNLGVSPVAQKMLLDIENLPADRFDSYNNYSDCQVVSSLFMPVVFSKENASARKSTVSSEEMLSEKKRSHPYTIEVEAMNYLKQDTELEAMRRENQAAVIGDSPQLVQYAQSALPEAIEQRVITRKRNTNLLRLDEKTKVSEIATLNMGLPKFSYWSDSFTSSVQLAQLSLSDNWYQGGVSNLNLTSSQSYTISYDDLNKIKFSTTVLWKLGLNSTPDDTVRSYYLNEDQFRIESAYSIKAYEQWYYNLSLLFNTQLFNNYISNSTDKSSSFMSPTQINIGLGMTYSYTNKAKTLTCSSTVSPVALGIYFVVDTVGIDYSYLSLDEGELYMQDVGTSLEYKMTWKIQEDLSWTTRFFFFTDYDYMQGDLENTVTFAVSRYFSTSVFLHLRYDDSVDTSTISPWQVKEQVGFGFNYKF